MRTSILILILTLAVSCAGRRPMTDADREAIARMGQAFGNYQAEPSTIQRKKQTVCTTYQVGYAYQTRCYEQ